MREIKFRAWHRKFKEWHYYTLLTLVSTESKEQIANSKYFYVKFLDYENKFLDYENWCEYTGLKDKNGKEIYEGDIVQDRDNEIYRVLWGGQFNYAGFGIERKRKKHEYGSRPMTWDVLNKTWEKDIQIIGNIYENPELLEETK